MHRKRCEANDPRPQGSCQTTALRHWDRSKNASNQADDGRKRYESAEKSSYADQSLAVDNPLIVLCFARHDANASSHHRPDAETQAGRPGLESQRRIGGAHDEPRSSAGASISVAA